MARSNIDKALINTLATLLHENNLSEIEYDAEGIRLRVVCAPSPSVPVSGPVLAPLPVSLGNEKALDKMSPPTVSEENIVKSPMVGIVYIAPEPGASPYVKVGDTVKEGQTLFLIEAMKTFNAVKAPHTGRVSKIIVQDAQAVEFGDPLLILE